MIAINQDPLGRAANRVSRNLDAPKDKYGIGETQVWSGPLYGGDQVVVLLNAAGNDVNMTTDLNEIFVAEGPEGSTPQAKEKWAIYDLWANRMEERTAQAILDAPFEHLEGVFAKLNVYNSTRMPYVDGLRAGDERLMGKMIGQIAPGGEIKTMVQKHSVKMYRLRSLGLGEKRHSTTRDEL